MAIINIDSNKKTVGMYYVNCEGQNNNLTYYKKKNNTNWNHYDSGTVLVTSLINE